MYKLTKHLVHNLKLHRHFQYLILSLKRWHNNLIKWFVPTKEKKVSWTRSTPKRPINYLDGKLHRWVSLYGPIKLDCHSIRTFSSCSCKFPPFRRSFRFHQWLVVPRPRLKNFKKTTNPIKYSRLQNNHIPIVLYRCREVK